MKEKILFFFVSLLFAIIVTRLFFLQIIGLNIPLLKQKGVRKIPPTRGEIIGIKGAKLAVNKVSYTLFAQPEIISSESKLINKLSPLLEIEPSSLGAKLKKSKKWVILAKGIDIETRKKIEKLKEKGIGFQTEMKRFYPEASLSAHLLGFVGKNSEGDDVGYFGIEGYYNQELRGLEGFVKTGEENSQTIPAEDGATLILNVDASIQEMARDGLLYAMEHYKPKKACITIADPYTLQIKALACLPDYSPNEYWKYDTSLFTNPVISQVYEPGSVFKPLIVAAALQEKAITKDSTVNEDKPVSVGGHLIRTWDNKYEGKMTISHVLERSSNVGMVKIGRKLGEKKILEYIKKFGFGKKTGIDLQGEARGKVKKRWYPIDYDTVTFGQGIGVTQIQLVRALSSVINGGKLLRPYVVNKIITGNEERKINPQEQGQVIKNFVSKIVKQYLYNVVEKGEVKRYKIEGYKIGGKTGTAQIPTKGKYDFNKTVASFVGFTPLDHPRFIMLVTLFEPEASPWGSETAAPVFFRVAKRLIVYYGINKEE